MPFNNKITFNFAVFNAALGFFSVMNGLTGTIMEHNKIITFAYANKRIPKFDQHMISSIYHLKTMAAYAIAPSYFFYGYPFHRKKYIDVIRGFHSKIKYY